MEYNKQLFVSNVLFLCKKKGIQQSQLEKDLDLSRAYFNRLNSSSSNTAPKLESLLKICDKLDVSLESLISLDFAKLDDKTTKLVNFLDKMIEKTSTRKYVWDCETSNELDFKEVETNATPKNPHPLYKPSLSEGLNGPIFYFYYSSMFTDDSIENVSPIYHMEFKNNKFYLSHVYRHDSQMLNLSQSSDEIDPEECSYNIFELYLVDDKGKPSPVCMRRAGDKDPVAERMEKLYDLCADFMDTNSPLRENVTSVIDDFMMED